MYAVEGRRPTALVVGAAGCSGGECARLLAERRFRMICADNDSAGLREIADRVGATPVFCDVESDASVAIFVRDVAARLGLPDVVVNAAGHTYVRTLGMIRVTRAFTPLLKDRATPCTLVNVASSKEEKVISFSGSHHGFGSIARSLERNHAGSCITVATCMSSAVEELLEVLYPLDPGQQLRLAS